MVANKINFHRSGVHLKLGNKATLHFALKCLEISMQIEVFISFNELLLFILFHRIVFTILDTNCAVTILNKLTF